VNAVDAFSRRIALWRLLSRATEPLRLRDLARRLEVSKHTVQRDIDALTRAGVQVEEERDGQALRYVIRDRNTKLSR
jgi:predicted DNA-binding transcriptional regulator YafY